MTAFTAPTPEVPRDTWGRPLVIPEGGGKPVAYTRCTRFVGVIEDLYNLHRWDERNVAVGLSLRPDLLLRASSVGAAALAGDANSKNDLNDICTAAKEAAKASAAATTGTALHKFTETLDRGEEVPVIPEAYLEDLEAYEQATRAAGLTHTHVEAFTVHDPLKVGGTPDRITRYRGKRYVFDVKTGTIDLGSLKIAAQLAIYARSKTYSPVDGARAEHGAEIDRGIVAHLPAGQGICRLYWVDLVAGWDAVRVCRDVWEQRRRDKFRDLFEPFEETLDIEGLNAAAARALTGELGAKVVESGPPTAEDLAALVRAAGTVEEIRELWRSNARTWTDALTVLAKGRIGELPK